MVVEIKEHAEKFFFTLSIKRPPNHTEIYKNDLWIEFDFRRYNFLENTLGQTRWRNEGWTRYILLLYRYFLQVHRNSKTYTHPFYRDKPRGEGRYYPLYTL